MAMNQPTGTATNAKTLTADRLQRVEDLLQALKADAHKAEQEGDTFMLGVYKELLRVTSPIVVRAHARFEREDNATLNKAHKNLLKAERQKQGQSNATP
jgi:hypothetical protein